ncbi:MAG TPA: hypothetical protein VNS88_04155 [Nitrospiraceae bacterium]|nr:hypothetical protein [Nitrospiraceae bacterium]
MTPALKKEVKRIYGALETVKEDLQTVYNNLEETMEEKSDKWKESEAGEAAQGELENLESSIDAIETACDSLNEYTQE